MVERYGVAAIRHLASGDLLLGNGKNDDAGYHYGVSGENVLKHALLEAGLKPLFQSLDRAANPLGKHYPQLGQTVSAAALAIKGTATGRHAAPLTKVIDAAGFNSLFDGWKIEIRYHDSSCCPVPEAKANQWKADAEHLVLELVV